ncbi:hypothetical protein [Methylicorpusculum sp.]|uniref:hypothetical protein n=1 Tax=Methylicorpusculum sp. TaxID=2713644 RepID=UPI00272A018E|nr:hypothetical protein [Methylicorpusculum sp.]
MKSSTYTLNSKRASSFKENNSFQDGFTSNSQFEEKKGLGKLFEDVGSRADFYSGQYLHFHRPWRSDAAVKPPWKGLRRSSKGFPQPKMTPKRSN